MVDFPTMYTTLFSMHYVLPSISRTSHLAPGTSAPPGVDQSSCSSDLEDSHHIGRRRDSTGHVQRHRGNEKCPPLVLRAQTG